MEDYAMTNIRKRLDNILSELAILQEALKRSNLYPPCCLKIYKDGKISCDIIGPLPKEEFLKECLKCRESIKRFVSQINTNRD
jgi:hypothetical protein